MFCKMTGKKKTSASTVFAKSKGVLVLLKNKKWIMQTVKGEERNVN